MFHGVQKNELTVSQQHLLNIHQNVGPKWKPHSSVECLTSRLPYFVYFMRERMSSLLRRTSRNRMPTCAHDLGLGSSRSMSVKWSEMMGSTVVGSFINTPWVFMRLKAARLLEGSIHRCTSAAMGGSVLHLEVGLSEDWNKRERERGV